MSVAPGRLEVLGDEDCSCLESGAPVDCLIASAAPPQTLPSRTGRVGDYSARPPGVSGRQVLERHHGSTAHAAVGSECHHPRRRWSHGTAARKDSTLGRPLRLRLICARRECRGRMQRVTATAYPCRGAEQCRMVRCVLPHARHRRPLPSRLLVQSGANTTVLPGRGQLLPEIRIEQVLSGIDTSEGSLKVKDSFAALDLAAAGFRPSLRAYWLAREPLGLASESRSAMVHLDHSAAT